MRHFFMCLVVSFVASGCYLSHELSSVLPTEDGGSLPGDAGPIGECTIGETRHCYTGPPGTDGIGRCHGSEHTCILGADGVPTWDQHPPDCIGEVTPNPWGDILVGGGLGVDDDCDGAVDDLDFSFCGDFGPAWPPETFGYAGCCTRAAFMTRSDLPPPGTLIKGSNHVVYFLSVDGMRHVFPTSPVLASWYHEPSFATLSMDGPVACSQVVQIPDELLVTLTTGRNVTFRPGSVLTGIESDPAWYAVMRGGVLRQIPLDLLMTPGWYRTCPVRVDDHLLLMDSFFVDYTLGTPITSLSEYDACAEAATTIEAELALAGH